MSFSQWLAFVAFLAASGVAGEWVQNRHAERQIQKLNADDWQRRRAIENRAWQLNRLRRLVYVVLALVLLLG